jgi:adenylate cyclase
MSPKTLSQDVESSCSSLEVLSELKLILSHELFNNSAVLSNFLKYIVEETLAGNLRSLKEYTIGVNGLGKKADFNPQIDAIVRIHAGRLRRLLTEYYNGPGSQDRILIEVVKGSYVPVFSYRHSREDLPMILSPSMNEIRHITVSKVSLAILPFRNLCPNGEHQYFADALGEEFTRVFSLSQEFSVIGHQSTLKHADLHTDLRTIGAKLHAQYIVTGAVMRDENNFRITVGLLEADSRTQLWSKVFEYKTKVGFLQVQDETIQDVYAALGGPFGFIVRHSALTSKTVSEDAIAFDAALYNYQFQTNFSFFCYAKTRKVLEVILQGNPQFATALGMLSEFYLWGHVLGYPTADNPVSTSLRLAHKARNIDPLSKQASFSFLWASLYAKANENIQHEIDQLLHQSPPATLDAAKLATLLVWAGHYEGAGALLEQSIRQHPHYPWSFDLALGLLYFKDGRYADALEVVDRIGATDVYLVDLIKIVLLTRLGLPKDAAYHLNTLEENYSFVASHLKTHLSNFLLDKTLIDQILDGVREAREGLR